MTLQGYIKEVKERLDRATPGPWVYDSGNGEVETHASEHYRISVADRPDISERFNHVKQFGLKIKPPTLRHPDEDMELIAHAPDDLQKLIRIVEVMWGALKFECCCTEPGVLCDACETCSECDKIARGEG